MSITVYNENFCEITEQEIQDNPYARFIVPHLYYLAIPQDTKIMWYEYRKDIEFYNDVATQQTRLDFDKLDNSDIDVVLAFWCDHDWPLDNQILTRLAKSTKPCVVLSWTTQIEKHENALFFPFWAMTYPIGRGVRIPTLNEATNRKRNYLASCINARHQFDRFINLTSMQQYWDFFNPGRSIITCPLIDHATNNAVDVDQIANKIKESWPAGATIFKEKLVPLLPLQHPSMSVIDFSNSASLVETITAAVPAYTDAYINIIGETSQFDPFVSEKSLKPMLAGQLFVTIGVPGTIQLLTNLGFDVFDDIIEHSRYSEYPDVHIRVQELHAYIGQMNQWNWEQIFKETEHRRLQNRNHLLRNVIFLNYMKQLEQRINECI